MENVIGIDPCVVRAMVDAQEAGLTFEQFVDMVKVANEQFAILPYGRSIVIVEELEVDGFDMD